MFGEGTELNPRLTCLGSSAGFMRALQGTLERERKRKTNSINTLPPHPLSCSLTNETKIVFAGMPSPVSHKGDYEVCFSFHLRVPLRHTRKKTLK